MITIKKLLSKILNCFGVNLVKYDLLYQSTSRPSAAATITISDYNLYDYDYFIIMTRGADAAYLQSGLGMDKAYLKYGAEQTYRAQYITNGYNTTKGYYYTRQFKITGEHSFYYSKGYQKANWSDTSASAGALMSVFYLYGVKRI